MKLKQNTQKITNFLGKYEAKIVVFVGLILVSIISFEAGIMKGQEWQKKPLIIEKRAEMILGTEIYENASEGQNLALSEPGLTNNSTAFSEDKKNVNCAFIGSKNSNKYHSPDCTWATRIKPENRVCFENFDDAKNKGYITASCLKK